MGKKTYEIEFEFICRRRRYDRFELPILKTLYRRSKSNHAMTMGLAKIPDDVDNLRLEFKTELVGIKSTIKDLETSLNSSQHNVEDLEGNGKKMTEDHTKTTEDLKSLNITRQDLDSTRGEKIFVLI